MDMKHGVTEDTEKKVRSAIDIVHVRGEAKLSWWFEVRETGIYSGFLPMVARDHCPGQFVVFGSDLQWKSGGTLIWKAQ